MRCAPRNTADVDRARELRLPWVGEIVLAHLAGSPAGNIQKFVIHGEVDVGHQRRHCAKPLQEGRQLVLGRRLGRDRRRLLGVELAAFAPPGPDRAFEVRGVDHHAKKPYSRTGSCAGRTSSAIWWLAPRSIVWTLRRARRSQKWT